ncbi:hypothetical protein [Xylophilus sp. Leaf220]|uniref:hypothetical protein n=1 Tax=Xylophilus sp. Leaf220 TaxID=1735686 RepID=UPI001F20EC5D|nr:hypothetical protein [Xylophilus sp. Leaf220]
MDQDKTIDAAPPAPADTANDPAADAHDTQKRTPLLQGTAASLPDDAMLTADIAALYLRITPADFVDTQRQRRPEGRTHSGRADKGGKAAPAQNTFRLGTLREQEKKQPAPTGLEAATKSGLLGWASAKLPFFAELEPRVKRGRRVLIGNAWDTTNPEREAWIGALVKGRIRVTWITSSEAAASLWSDAATHRAFAARGLALLGTEIQVIEASVVASERLAADTPSAAGPAEA